MSPGRPPRTVGGQSETGAIRTVILKHPRDAFGDEDRIESEWRALGWSAKPDLARASDEHDRFAEMLRGFGAGTTYLPAHEATGLDSIYTRDAVVMCDRGAIVCNMGKTRRRGEPGAFEEFGHVSGIPIAGRIAAGGRLEGGDVVWLDRRTVAVGEGYRTNAEGIRQLALILGESVDEVMPVPLPHWRGPGEVLHLMSLLSPVAPDLAVVYSPLLPVPFRQRLTPRGIGLVEVPDEEFASMGCNVLAVAPRVCLMLAGNPRTRALLEAAGVEVHTFRGSEISRKGAGGPTCLTRPLLRDAAPG